MNSMRAPFSRFEIVAALSEHLPLHADDVFGALLTSTRPRQDSANWTPRPLWNEEAMHRAYRMLQLLLRLRASRQGSGNEWRADYTLAVELAADIRSLATARENEALACSTVLRNVVRNLGSLFGPASGDIELTTRVERLSLPGCRRRALVLAAGELVINALSHAFPGCGRGRIHVCLERMAGDRAALRVSDDGVGGIEGCADTSSCLAGRLAQVLEGRLLYRQHPSWATTAEIVFPAPCSSARALRETRPASVNV